MFSKLQAEAKILINDIIQLVYFMRGAVQYDDMMWRTPFERDMFADFIKKRLEDESKKPNPVY